MSNDIKKFLRLIAGVFTFAIFVYIFDYKNLNLPITSGFDLGLFIGYFSQFFILGYIIYKFIGGIVVSDKSLIIRNVFILFFINFII
ncbi:MAG TPA: hypothetical protein VIG94_09060, partial [Faecalibacter sp.]